jgi:hypothetical protein
MICRLRLHIACSGARKEQKSRRRKSQRKTCKAGESLQSTVSTTSSILHNGYVFCTRVRDYSHRRGLKRQGDRKGRPYHTMNRLARPVYSRGGASPFISPDCAAVDAPASLARWISAGPRPGIANEVGTTSSGCLGITTASRLCAFRFRQQGCERLRYQKAGHGPENYHRQQVKLPPH